MVIIMKTEQSIFRTPQVMETKMMVFYNILPENLGTDTVNDQVHVLIFR